MQAPISIGELELTEPITGIQLPVRADGAAYNGVQLLVRMQRIPVGYAFLSPDGLSPRAVVRQVWSELGATVNRRRARAGLPALERSRSTASRSSGNWRTSQPTTRW